MIHVSVIRFGGQCIFEGIAVDPGSIVATLRVKVEEGLEDCFHCRLLSPLGEPRGDLETIEGTGVKEGDDLRAIIFELPRIVASKSAFALIGSYGSVITWGKSISGGNRSAVKDAIASGVQQVYSTDSVFAAVKDGGSVITWGASDSGGDSSAVKDALASGVQQVYSTDMARAVTKGDGSDHLGLQRKRRRH